MVPHVPIEYSIGMQIQIVELGFSRAKKPPLIPLGDVMMNVRLL